MPWAIWVGMLNPLTHPPKSMPWAWYRPIMCPRILCMLNPWPTHPTVCPEPHRPIKSERHYVSWFLYDMVQYIYIYIYINMCLLLRTGVFPFAYNKKKFCTHHVPLAVWCLLRTTYAYWVPKTGVFSLKKKVRGENCKKMEYPPLCKWLSNNNHKWFNHHHIVLCFLVSRRHTPLGQYVRLLGTKNWGGFPQEKRWGGKTAERWSTLHCADGWATITIHGSTIITLFSISKYPVAAHLHMERAQDGLHLNWLCMVGNPEMKPHCDKWWVQGQPSWQKQIPSDPFWHTKTMALRIAYWLLLVAQWGYEQNNCSLLQDEEEHTLFSFMYKHSISAWCVKYLQSGVQTW